MILDFLPPGTTYFLIATVVLITAVFLATIRGRDAS